MIANSEQISHIIVVFTLLILIKLMLAGYTIQGKSSKTHADQSESIDFSWYAKRRGGKETAITLIFENVSYK